MPVACGLNANHFPFFDAQNINKPEQIMAAFCERIKALDDFGVVALIPHVL